VQVLLMRKLVEQAPYIRAFLRSERGQGMVEYALILFLVSIGAVLFLTAIGFDIKEVFDSVENALGLGDGEAPAPTGDNDQAGPADPAP
jgi:Flp pilus assembly pilin Flp